MRGAASPPSATNPPRGFTEEAWRATDRPTRRQLIQALMTEAGATFKNLQSRGRYDDLLMASDSPFGERTFRLRITDDRCDSNELTKLAETAARGDADYLLIGTATDDASLRENDHYLPVRELIEWLEASAFVTWTDGRPTADRDALVAERRHRLDFYLNDNFGLRALAPLSRNKLPWSMRMIGATGPADEWFERMFFRVATTACGLAGRRFGSADRGSRVADGLLHAHGSSDAVLYDCKAARDGYAMTADHERRLIEYAEGEPSHDGRPMTVKYVVIVSSGFPGPLDGRHPFYRRQRAFLRRGYGLAYIEAADIVNVALKLRSALDLDTAVADRINWFNALSVGLVGREDLLKVVNHAISPTGHEH
jgi:hypothetical protein